MVKLVVFFSLFSFLSVHVNAENFYSDLCEHREEFEIERLYQEDISGKIISDRPKACEVALKYNDWNFIQFDSQSKVFENDALSQSIVKITQDSSGGKPAVGPHRHLQSLLIGLVVAHTWDRLSLDERIAFRTNASCDKATEVGKLPKFSDLSRSPGKGDSVLLANIQDLCNDDFNVLISKLPRALFADALFILKESGYDTTPFLRAYCESFVGRFRDKKDPFFLRQLYVESKKRGALKTMKSIRDLYGLSPTEIWDNQDKFILKQNLSEKEINAIKTWKGSSYIWVSNREEFGLLGDVFSLFHRNGGISRRPSRLGENTKMLSKTLDELPPHRGLVFRGISSKNPEEDYVVGEEIEFDRFSSTSTSVKVAYDFAGATGEERVVLILLSNSGRNIMGIRPNKSEREVLFPPGAKFKIIRTKRNKYTFKVYAIEE